MLFSIMNRKLKRNNIVTNSLTTSIVTVNDLLKFQLISTQMLMKQP